MFHILVVEDDAKLRSLFCTVLTNNGYLALPAESGEKALSLLDSEYVDLIISDIMMSGMDGYELIDHLRTSGFTMPILIITAKERFEDKQRGFQAGTDESRLMSMRWFCGLAPCSNAPRSRRSIGLSAKIRFSTTMH